MRGKIIERALLFLFQVIWIFPGYCQLENKQWIDDFNLQRDRPKLEAAYGPYDRSKAFVTSDYFQMGLELSAKRGPKIDQLQIKTETPGNMEFLYDDGIYLELEDESGNIYKSSTLGNYPALNSKINIYRRGAYYDEIHWQDIFLAGNNGIANVYAELVLACYPEKIHLGLTMHVPEEDALKSSIALNENGEPTIVFYDQVNGDLKYSVYQSGEWNTGILDAQGDVGAYPCIVIKNNLPHISYYDRTNGNLKYMTSDRVDVVDGDAGGDVGQYTSIDVDELGRPVITYYDASNKDLKCAIYLDGVWRTSVLDSSGENGDIGKYSSLKIRNGQYHVSYCDSGNGWLKYMVIGSEPEILDCYAGPYTSLDFDDSDQPFISYYDRLNKDLKCRYKVSGVWHQETVDSEGNVGKYSSIVFHEGQPYIAYYDATQGAAKLAIKTGGVWNKEYLFDQGDSGHGSSLALDSDGEITMYCPFYDTENALMYCYRKDASSTDTFTLDSGVLAPLKVNSASLKMKIDKRIVARSSSSIPFFSEKMKENRDFIVCGIDQGSDIQFLSEQNTGMALIYTEPETDPMYAIGVEFPSTDSAMIISHYLFDRFCEQTVQTWTSGSERSLYFELLTLPSPAETSNKLYSEKNPIHESYFQIIPQPGEVTSSYGGYNRKLGFYSMSTPCGVQGDVQGGYWFTRPENVNHYDPVKLKVINDNIVSRKIYLRHEISGGLGGYGRTASLHDSNGDMLPILLQHAESWGYLQEYYDDTYGFSETYFPLCLGKAEKCTFTANHLYQNWGNHPLKQWSSLQAWVDYYHCSTGQSETTCYVPFKNGGVDGWTIGDLRPTSGPMWQYQPQHWNAAGHEFLFLLLKPGAGRSLEYTGTDYDSIQNYITSTGPNLACVSMNYKLANPELTWNIEPSSAKLDIFEIGSDDETRNFVHVRYDFKEEIKVLDNNLRSNAMLFRFESHRQKIPYQKIALRMANGEVVYGDLAEGTFDLGVLGSHMLWSPFVCLYNKDPVQQKPDGGPKYLNNAFIVKNVVGILGSSSQPNVKNLRAQLVVDSNKYCYLSLNPEVEDGIIYPGNYIEFDIMFLPFEPEVLNEEAWKTAERESQRFGVNAPRVNVQSGTKLKDFPSTVKVNQNETAEFYVTGGYNYIPIIVTGFSSYKNLKLQKKIDGVWVTVEHSSSPTAKDGYQVICTPDSKFGCVFLDKSNGGSGLYRAFRQ